MQYNLFRKGIIFTIVGLFVGLSVASSTVNIVEDVYDFGINEIASFKGSDKMFFAVDCSGYPSNSRFIWFDPKDPSKYNDIGKWSNTAFPQGAKYIKDEWWVCDNTGDIWTVDIITGECELVGNTGISELVSISYNVANKKLYGISTKEFYEIDMDNCNATLVGPMGNIGIMISLECDYDGVMYAYELDPISGDVYTINIETGHACKIGESGVSLEFEQEMAYDADTDNMYACVFNYNTFQGELHKINLVTGKFTYIDTLYNGHQTTCLAIPNFILCNNPPDTPIINGQKQGKIGVEYEYNILISEPDNDSLFLRVDWGNGTLEPWQGPYAFNTTVRLNHTWNEKGNYTIRVQSIDIFGKKSDWATLDVTMPKTYNPMWWLSGLLDRFPLLQRFLDTLMDWRSV